MSQSTKTRSRTKNTKTLRIGIDGNWTARDFNMLYDSMGKLYGFYFELVHQEQNSSSI